MNDFVTRGLEWLKTPLIRLRSDGRGGKDLTTINPADSRSIIVNKLDVRPIVRQSQDVAKWRAALQSAEGYGQHRSTLYDIYDDALLDGFVAACMEKRVCRITNANLAFSVNGKPVDAIAAVVKKTWFECLLKELMHARFWGHSLLELHWPSPGSTAPGETTLIPRRHVKPRWGIVVKNPWDTSGIEYRRPPFARTVLECGDAEDLGRLLQVSLLALIKRGNLGDWAEFVEVFGMPFRWATYQNEQTREVLKAALESMGAAGYAIGPEDAKMEFVSPTGTQSGNDIFNQLRSALNEEISIALLGNSMTTTEAAHSGYAQSKTHAESQEELHASDRRYILRLLDEKVTPYLAALGYPVADGEWSWQDGDGLTLAERLEVDLKVATKVPVGQTYWYEKYGIPRPAKSDLPESGMRNAESGMPGEGPDDDDGADDDDDDPDSGGPDDEERLSDHHPAGCTCPTCTGNFPTTSVAPKNAVIASRVAGEAIFGQPTEGVQPGARTTPDDTPSVGHQQIASPASRLAMTASGDAGGNGLSLAEPPPAEDSPDFQSIPINSKLTERYLKAVYRGRVKTGDVHKEMWQAYQSEFRRAIDTGTGRPALDLEYGPDWLFNQKLHGSMSTFAAFKNHSNTADLVVQLTGADGRLKTFSQFKKDVAPLIGDYNKHWLQAEYQTAVAGARNAISWQNFRRRADVYPNLRFVTQHDERVRESHAALDGIVRPIGDPFWQTHSPPLDWRCRCHLTQTDDPANPERTATEFSPEPPFDTNPGQTAQVFPESHPYFETAEGNKTRILAQAKEYYAQATAKEARAWAAKNAADLTFDLPDLPAPGRVSAAAVEAILASAHPEAAIRNRLLPILPHLVGQLTLTASYADTTGQVAHWVYGLQLETIRFYLHFYRQADDSILLKAITDTP